MPTAAATPIVAGTRLEVSYKRTSPQSKMRKEILTTNLKNRKKKNNK
jgi:hypothetical protein